MADHLYMIEGGFNAMPLPHNLITLYIRVITKG